MAHRELLTAWLKDAYSMEMGLIPIMENHAKDAKDYAQLKARIEQHVEETRRHAELVKQALERLGESPSGLKTALGGIMGAFQSMTTGPFQDEVVKNGIADYAAEHFEMASYMALVAAARELGDEETVRTCLQILQDEQAMARFLGENLPEAVRSTLAKKMAQHDEKHRGEQPRSAGSNF